MGTLLEVKVRLAGPDGRTRPTQFFANTQVAEAAKQLREPFGLDAGSFIFLMFKGKILSHEATLGECGIVSGDTVFLVDEAQPASWKKGTPMTAGESEESMLAGQEGPSLQEHSQAQNEENPLVNLIREIQSQVKHLRRSNQELQAAGPDPDFEEAVDENCVSIAKKEALIADLISQLQQVQGANLYGVSDTMQVEASGGVFL